MPILESKPDHSKVHRMLLATGLGAIFGFHNWIISAYCLAASIPPFGPAWIFLGYLILGCSIGLTAGCTTWWKRGWVLGLLFSVPSALCAHALGVKYTPYGVAVVVASLVSGLLVAFLTDTLIPFAGKLTLQPSELPQPSRAARYPRVPEGKTGTIGQRLCEEKTLLEDLDAERDRRSNSDFGRMIENRVIWGELLDLELQEIDEQVSRICRAAGTESPPAKMEGP